MKCKNCVNYDGEYCEAQLDEYDNNYKPKGVVYCKDFVSGMKKYQRREQNEAIGI